ncbi:MAG: YnfA family protein [Chitinophagales bacterium]|nr:YnfA family protein [Chitinophagales bacterium]MDW8419248.1 YnfA family protein [Chitinophagales bacterium]
MMNIVWFTLSAVFEIFGCYTFWKFFRQQQSAWWLLPGVVSLLLFAYTLTRVEVSWAGRSYAAYGGIYIAMSLLWMWHVEGKAPDAWDIAGAVVSVAGALIIIYGANR